MLSVAFISLLLLGTITGNGQIQNGDFEDGMTGWTINNPSTGISPWIAGSDSAHCIEIGGGDIPGAILSQNFFLPTGPALLTFDFLALGDPGRTGILRVDLKTSANQLLASATFTNAARNTAPYVWGHKSISFSVPSGVSSLTLAFVDLSPFSGIAVDPCVDRVVAISIAPWQRTYGGTNDDVLASVQQTWDGGNILGGFSRSGANGNKTTSNFGDYDFWLLKLDYTGSNLWQKTFGGSDDDRAHSIQQTFDGGYIVGGYSYSPASGNKTAPNRGNADFWVLRLDEKANPIWENSYGGSAFDSLQKCERLLDGGFLLGGYSSSPVSGNKTAANHGLNDYWLVRIDAGGNPIWDKSFGGSAEDVLHDVKPTSDGGFILAGATYSGISGNKTNANFGQSDGWIVRLDSAGNKLWEKEFGGTSFDELWSVQPTSDGGYLAGGRSFSGISGNKSSTNHGNMDGWIIRLEGNGNKLWDKSFGGTNIDVLMGVEQTRDGGYMLAGHSASGVSGNKTISTYGQTDWWLLQLDANGTVVDQQSFGGGDLEELLTFKQTRSGGFLLGGFSTSPISGNKTNANFGLTDMWLVRLGSTSPGGLNIARKPPGVEVFWDFDFANWTLQSTASFSPINWQNVTQPPLTNNGYLLVPFSNLNDKAFFRLKKN